MEQLKNILKYFKGFEEGDNITITIDFIEYVELLKEVIEKIEKEK